MTRNFIAGTLDGLSAGILDLDTAPDSEPISTAEAKSHMRIDAADEDADILSRIKGAREYVESFTRRALITQTWKLILSGFPLSDAVAIRLPKAPLQSITSIEYVDLDGVTQTWAASNYDVQALSGPYARPGRVMPAYNQTWPTDVRTGIFAPVTITFVAGYGDDALDVPEELRQAVRVLVSDKQETRGSEITGTIHSPHVRSAEALMWPYRVLDA